MNSLIAFLGIESWKPLITALLMPPVPFLVMALVGARTILWRRGVGWTLVLLSCTGLWLTSTTAFGEWFTRLALLPPPPLLPELPEDLATALASAFAFASVLVDALTVSNPPA